MSAWRVVYSRQAQKDAKKLATSGLKPRAKALLNVITEDPFVTPARYEQPVGDLAGCYSRRLNTQHRLVYEVLPGEHVVHVLRMWTVTSRATPSLGTPPPGGRRRGLGRA